MRGRACFHFRPRIRIKDAGMPKKKQRNVSARERERRAQQSKQSVAVEQLLYSRRQSARALGGISIATIIRLENKGLLDKIRLAGGNGQVFNTAARVHALAEGEAA
jgi:hypothetical protein